MSLTVSGVRNAGSCCYDIHGAEPKETVVKTAGFDWKALGLIGLGGAALALWALRRRFAAVAPIVQQVNLEDGLARVLTSSPLYSALLPSIQERIRQSPQLFLDPFQATLERLAKQDQRIWSLRKEDIRALPVYRAIE